MIIKFNSNDNCKICGIKIKEINKNDIGIYKNRTLYVAQRLILHLKKAHSISIEEYCRKFMQIQIPLCKCGCGKEVDIKKRIDGKGIEFKEFITHHRTKENCENIKKFSERLSISRTGKGNPMFGRVPWNMGLTAKTSPILKLRDEKRKGYVTSE